jgi:Ca-activated chloride channel family protein
VADAPCDRLRTPAAAISRSSSNVTVTLSDGVLHYEVDETFVNQGSRIGEADYIFPLPHNAAFTGLKLSIDGQLVGGETMDADHARAIYEEIVRRRRDPALVEWMGYGMLRTRIFPILAGESRRVVVRFDQIAEREGDALRIDYVRGDVDARRRLIELASTSSASSVEPSVSFSLRYSGNGKYGKPYSPTHDLHSSIHNGMNVVSASGSAAEVTVLVPTPRANGQPVITLLANANGRDDGFALINVSPPSEARDVTPRDITFALDVSGSMAGEKMEQARAAGYQLLQSLNARDRFRLIDFSSDVRSFRDGFSQATPANIRSAQQYLAGLSAEGSTNISGALAEALRASDDHDAHRLKLVLFLTDGMPTVGETNADAIAQQASRTRGSARVFTFGLGADVNASLLEQLALQGRGTAQFVRPSENVERAVSVVSSRLTNPVATDVRVSTDGVQLRKLLPGTPIDVFAGQNIVILARYSGSGSATLHLNGSSAGGPVHWTQQVTFPREQDENPFIGRLWATQRIGYLSAERRRVGANAELDAEIRSLGEQFGIPTEFTSYLVQEPTAVAAGGTTLMRTLSASSPKAAAPAFEAARRATEQRAAVSLASADKASPGVTGMNANGAVRHVGDHTFTLTDGAWTDTQVGGIATPRGAAVINVRAFSAAYFRVLEIAPSLRPMLALGDRVVVAGHGVVLKVGPDGIANLDARAEAALRAGW